MKRHLLVTALAAAVLSTAAFAAAPADNGDMMMPRHGRHHDMDKKDFERMRADFLARVDTNKDGKISRAKPKPMPRIWPCCSTPSTPTRMVS